MRTAWHDIWGGAHGRVLRLTPRVRIACGGCVFAACLAAPAATPAGSLFITAATGLWLLAVRPPARVAAGALLFGLVLFLPYFLLAPVIRMESAAGGWREAMIPPWTVFIRGIAAMQVTIATLSALTASDLRRGLLGLPVPGVLSAVLVQIVHQAAVLFYETRRIASAIAVRGGTSGVGTAARVLVSLPRVWLPRMLDRVERVAAAMEMRGYAEFDLRTMDGDKGCAADLPALAAAVLILAASVAMRLLGGG